MSATSYRGRAVASLYQHFVAIAIALPNLCTGMNQGYDKGSTRGRTRAPGIGQRQDKLSIGRGRRGG